MATMIDVGVLGATGMVGQQFVSQLQGHPWFRLTWLGASARSAGKRYAAAAHWNLDGAVPEAVARMIVHGAAPSSCTPRLVFSAVDASAAGELELEFAKAGHYVVSNARNHRMLPDVPLLVPEINADHLALLETQRGTRGWDGAILTNPNCSTVGLTMSLAPLKPFGIRSVQVATLQATSGAGYPGLPSMDIVANAIPFIPNEEEKMESETRKILGELAGGRIHDLNATISAQCNRVQVVDGHLLSVSVGLDRDPGIEGVRRAFAQFRGIPQDKGLPTAPRRPVHLLEEEDRPQPRKDSLREKGMVVCIGRLRTCPVLSYKFSALVHNTIRGAAGAAVLNAELLHAEGLLQS